MLLLSSKLTQTYLTKLQRRKDLLVFGKLAELGSQDVLLLVLNSSTLLNGVYVLTGLGLSGALLSELVLFRRQEKAHSVKVRAPHSWNAMAVNLCLCIDIDRLKLNLSVHLVCSILLFYNAPMSI